MHEVALFTRAWIEIVTSFFIVLSMSSPSLRGRGLKSVNSLTTFLLYRVALFTRAWIEILSILYRVFVKTGRPLYEGVD